MNLKRIPLQSASPNGRTPLGDLPRSIYKCISPPVIAAVSAGNYPDIIRENSWLPFRSAFSGPAIVFSSGLHRSRVGNGYVDMAKSCHVWMREHVFPTRVPVVVLRTCRCDDISSCPRDINFDVLSAAGICGPDKKRRQLSSIAPKLVRTSELSADRLFFTVTGGRGGGAGNEKGHVFLFEQRTVWSFN